MSTVASIWRELETEGPFDASGRVVRRLVEAGPCGMYLFVHHPSGCRGLAIEAMRSEVPPQLRFESTAGYAVDVRTEAGRDGATSFFFLASGAMHNEIFSSVAEDVTSVAREHRTQPEALAAIAARMQAWAQFFKRSGQAGLSEEARRGLVAELLVLRDIMMVAVTPAEAIASWAGPEGRPHDFVGPGASVEVKSSIGASPGVVRINGTRQLDERVAQRPLVLIVQYLEPVVGTGVSIPALADFINEQLYAVGPRLAEQFQERLLAAGCPWPDRHRYAESLYVARTRRCYEVQAGFPRVLEDTVPSGVEDVRYSLNLTACEPFKCSEDRVLELLRS